MGNIICKGGQNEVNTLIREQIVTLADIHCLFNGHYPLARPRQTSIVEVVVPSDVPTAQGVSHKLAYMLGSLLERPIKQVTVQSHVGRFYHVFYEAARQDDPDIVLTDALDGQVFHSAMIRFQIHRLQYWTSPTERYRKMRQQARLLLNPLARLLPTPEEADFVIGWILDTLTFADDYSR